VHEHDFKPWPKSESKLYCRCGEMIDHGIKTKAPARAPSTPQERPPRRVRHAPPPPGHPPAGAPLDLPFGMPLTIGKDVSPIRGLDDRPATIEELQQLETAFGLGGGANPLSEAALIAEMAKRRGFDPTKQGQDPPGTYRPGEGEHPAWLAPPAPST
jgi:hypothetical protein